eukprot:CAMPEP_0179006888 /NCGR_PEP_ID=MMETSP0795-20121207/14823_1 /TAXON_ID=88552 /ORGANISM="Amoebophrya sp., Strain Ameob2" /LENGTH=616 /DNA_ID=CAMNT_0020701737 /DNA_START=71 /DNA_END=1920 /DNA_ORIENTATION=+
MQPHRSVALRDPIGNQEKKILTTIAGPAPLPFYEKFASLALGHKTRGLRRRARSGAPRASAPPGSRSCSSARSPETPASSPLPPDPPPAPLPSLPALPLPQRQYQLPLPKTQGRRQKCRPPESPGKPCNRHLRTDAARTPWTPRPSHMLSPPSNSRSAASLGPPASAPRLLPLLRTEVLPQLSNVEAGLLPPETLATRAGAPPSPLETSALEQRVVAGGRGTATATSARRRKNPTNSIFAARCAVLRDVEYVLGVAAHGRHGLLLDRVDQAPLVGRVLHQQLLDFRFSAGLVLRVEQVHVVRADRPRHAAHRLPLERFQRLHRGQLLEREFRQIRAAVLVDRAVGRVFLEGHEQIPRRAAAREVEDPPPREHCFWVLVEHGQPRCRSPAAGRSGRLFNDVAELQDSGSGRRASLPTTLCRVCSLACRWIHRHVELVAAGRHGVRVAARDELGADDERRLSPNIRDRLGLPRVDVEVADPRVVGNEQKLMQGAAAARVGRDAEGLHVLPAVGRVLILAERRERGDAVGTGWGDHGCGEEKVAARESPGEAAWRRILWSTDRWHDETSVWAEPRGPRSSAQPPRDFRRADMCFWSAPPTGAAQVISEPATCDVADPVW